MCQHLGTCVEYLVEELGLGVEIGDQVLDAGAGVEAVDGSHGLGVEPGALVGEVVACDAGYRRVPQTHRLHTLGNAAGFVAVEFCRLTGVDLAEVAASGALFATDQEGGLTVFPALVDVGASRFFADRVQPFAFHESLELRILGAHRRACLDPLGLAFDRGLRVADLETQQLAAVGGGGSGGL